MTEPNPLHILFLCNHNTARSLMAEAVLNHMGGERFRAHSAGCQPSQDRAPHPLALEALRSAGIRTDDLHSKSWEAFAGPDAPHMDLIITVCDNAAGEACPVWPGHLATAHWGYADPSNATGSDEDRLHAFKQTLLAIHRRMELLINLPPAGLDRLLLQQQARELANRD